MSNSDFQTITRFLIQFITKEKQIESIVEKLSQRFPTASKVQQQRDLAYCLARLPHTEKSLKYLYQNHKLYSDALHDSVVADNFTSLVAKSRRGNSALTATAEMKEAIDKLDQFIVGKKEGKEEVRVCSCREAPLYSYSFVHCYIHARAMRWMAIPRSVRRHRRPRAGRNGRFPLKVRRLRELRQRRESGPSAR